MLLKKAKIIRQPQGSSEALESFIKGATATAADNAAQIKKTARKIGRPAAAEPIVKVGLSLPRSVVEEVDRIAATRYGRNRSMAVAELLGAVIYQSDKSDFTFHSK